MEFNTHHITSVFYRHRRKPVQLIREAAMNDTSNTEYSIRPSPTYTVTSLELYQYLSKGISALSCLHRLGTLPPAPGGNYTFMSMATRQASRDEEVWWTGGIDPRNLNLAL
jgi:hypothetical protein